MYQLFSLLDSTLLSPICWYAICCALILIFRWSALACFVSFNSLFRLCACVRVDSFFMLWLFLRCSKKPIFSTVNSGNHLNASIHKLGIIDNGLSLPFSFCYAQCTNQFDLFVYLFMLVCVCVNSCVHKFLVTDCNIVMPKQFLFTKNFFPIKQIAPSMCRFVLRLFHIYQQITKSFTTIVVFFDSELH